MAHRYRLYPAERQLAVLDRHSADARFVWNLALEQWSMWRPGRAPGPGPTERQRQLAEARQGTWLKESSSSVQQQALRDFDRAIANFFGRTHRRPRWRAKGRDEGFWVRDVTVCRLNRRWASVAVPKCGPVRFRLSRPLPEKVGMARVTLDAAARWHVTFSAPQPAIARVPTGAAVGIDRGVVNTLATSDGQMLRAPTSPKLAVRVGRLQARLSRQKPGSGRRAKTKRALARTHARMADRRRDWVERTTTRLVEGNDVVVLEDLKVKHMARRPRAKRDPSCSDRFLPNGARAKAGLNRSIHRSCWGLLQRRLKEKAATCGVEVLCVPAHHTSQQCRRCGHTAAESRESQAVFRCTRCGHTNHADRNAAENILARGLSVLAPTPGHGAWHHTCSAARTSPPPAAAGTSGRRAA